MQALHYMTINLQDFVLRNATEYSYGTQNAIKYEAKKPCPLNKAFSVFTDLNYI